jgi:2-keto-4-pentenoate hydratase/2-oxohepta-3-ene-1,7-dioic acid hydratase in catechol pathway
MTQWIAFKRDGRPGFGRLEGTRIAVCTGDLFGANNPTGETLDLPSVEIDVPCRPSKMIALWNNFHAAAAKQGLGRPEEPLLFIKPPNCYRPSGAVIALPELAGKVIFEGELGIVIGRAALDVSEAQAPDHIFGYTCVNDVTSLPILRADPSFTQWSRSKGLDGFGPFGPVIATDLDPASLVVRTLVDGVERQTYPISDMVFSAAQLVALLSRGMTLEPGDIISCGTSNGAGSIKPGATVEVSIEGIGVLANRFV